MDLKFNGTDSECATRSTIAYSGFWILPVVKLLLVRTPPIGNPIVMDSLFASAHLGNLTFTV